MIANGFGASHVWMKMIHVRELVEHNIWWQLKNGSYSFWFDNWTKRGALYYIEPQNYSEEEMDINYFVMGEVWDR